MAHAHRYPAQRPAKRRWEIRHTFRDRHASPFHGLIREGYPVQRKIWLLLAIIGFVWLAPELCHGENCAWLNAATAGGLLGGEVTMKVTHTTALDTTCEFTLKDKSPVSSLEIAVHTMASVSQEFPALLSQCSKTGSPLRAVGNEAVECTLMGGNNELTEQIVGRVRDRVFILKWKMVLPGADLTAPAKTDMQDRYRNIAEQVAGSLF